MCKLLTRLKYQVGEIRGGHFRRWNIAGMLFLAVYVAISIYNLLISSPSDLIWWLNLAIIGTIITKNKLEILELHDFYKNSRNPAAYYFISWHSNKLTAEVTFMMLTFVIFTIGCVCGLHLGKDDFFGFLCMFLGFITILMSAMEELLNIISNMYRAEKPLIDE